MSSILTYPLRLEGHDEENVYLAYFPDLPGCPTWDETHDRRPDAFRRRKTPLLKLITSQAGFSKEELLLL